MRLILLLIFTIGFLVAKAQTPAFFVSPGITFGYTFGAKINYGVNLDFGISSKEKIGNYKAGLSLGYYVVKTKHGTHYLRSFNLMAQNDFTSIKVGVGRARNPWGYGHRNRCIVHGFNYDVSVTLPHQAYSPWIGVKHFVYKPSQWAWFSRPYTSLYVQEKYDFVQQNNSLPGSSLFK